MAETIIEIAGERNQRVAFGPTGEVLRGRWSAFAFSGKSMHEALQALHAALPEGNIPGICLALDPKARTARRFDPLRETPEGRKCWAAIETVLKEYAGNLPNGRPWDELAEENLTDDQLKTWAYDMRNILDSGAGRHVSGPELPSRDEIRAMQGARILQNWMGPAPKRIDIVEEKGGEIKHPSTDPMESGVPVGHVEPVANQV